MDRFSKIFMIIWVVLALASFVSSFWAPIVLKVIGIAFGVMNVALIGSWTLTTIKEKQENNEVKEEE